MGLSTQPPFGAAQTPLFGRERETQTLASLIDQSDTPGQAVRFVGEAGIGKTRLARWTVEHVAQTRRVVVWGQASPNDAGLALGVFQDALRAYRRGPTGAQPRGDALAQSFPERVLPELGGVPADAPTGRAVVFAAAAQWLRALAQPHGLVLVLDDLHWADTTSLELVGRLVRDLRHDPVLFVLTYRPDEAAGSAALGALRRDLARQSLGAEIVLGPLAPDEVRRLVVSVAGTTPTPSDGIDEMARLSGGNPFVAQELALSGFRTKDSSDTRVKLPWALQDIVSARVDKLPENQRDLLCWAAVLGERFELPVLSAVSGLEQPDLHTSLRDLSTAGLIVEDPADSGGTRMAFRHALTQVAVESSMLRAERRRRHARILAAALDEVGQLSLEELLAHALGAGDRSHTLRLSLDAARRTSAIGALADSEEHYRRLVAGDAGPVRVRWRPVDGDVLRAEITSEWGRLLGVLRPGAAAIALLGEAGDAFAAIGDPVAAINTRVDAAHIRWKSGDPGGVRELEDIVEETEQAASLTVRVRACSGAASVLMVSGVDGSKAAALAARGLELVAGLDGPLATLERLRLVNVLGMAALQSGAFEEGRRLMHECGELATEVGHPAGPVIALGNLVVIGQWDSAPTLADVGTWNDEALVMATSRGIRGFEGWLASTRAALHLRAGEMPLVPRLLDRAVAALAEAPNPSHDRQMDCARAQWLLQTGDLGPAKRTFAAVLAEAVAELDEIEREARLGLAQTLMAAGEYGAAVDVVAPWVASIMGSVQMLRSYGSLLVAGIEASTLAGDGRAEAWAVLLSESAPGPRADYCVAITQRPPSVCADVSAALDAIANTGRQWEATRARLVAAELLRDSHPEVDGLAAAAREGFLAMGADIWVRRTERLLRGLGHHIPTRRTAVDGSGLTVREREVLALVSQGLGNADIARRLHLGLPTVETHLRNVYRKLGVRRRTEAVNVARQRGLLMGADEVLLD